MFKTRVSQDRNQTGPGPEILENVELDLTGTKQNPDFWTRPGQGPNKILKVSDRSSLDRTSFGIPGQNCFYRPVDPRPEGLPDNSWPIIGPFLIHFLSGHQN